MKRLLLCFVSLILSFVCLAQEESDTLTVCAHEEGDSLTVCQAQEDYAVSADSSEYITASLMVIQPDKESLITYYGHLALRLQCPSAGLDYCFSFDSFSSGSFWALVTGADRTTLLPIPTPDFIERYTSQCRKVYEHELNLTLSEERRLWQTVDRLVEMNDYLQTDFLNHGCAGETASIITSALNGQLQYPVSMADIEDSHYEIIKQYMSNDSWNKLMLSIFAGRDAHRQLANNEEKLALPSLLEKVWQETTIVGADGSERPVFAPKETVVYEASGTLEPDNAMTGPTPVTLVLLVVVIVLCLAEIFVGRIRVLSISVDALLMLIQTSVGVVLVGLLLCSTLPTTSGWNCNTVVFNPIPFLVWLVCLLRHPKPKVRCALFALYTAVIVGFLLYMCIQSTFFLLPQYYLVATLAVRCAWKLLEGMKDMKNERK